MAKKYNSWETVVEQVADKLIGDPKNSYYEEWIEEAQDIAKMGIKAQKKIRSVRKPDPIVVDDLENDDQAILDERQIAMAKIARLLSEAERLIDEAENTASTYNIPFVHHSVMDKISSLTKTDGDDNDDPWDSSEC